MRADESRQDPSHRQSAPRSCPARAACSHSTSVGSRLPAHSQYASASFQDNLSHRMVVRRHRFVGASRMAPSGPVDEAPLSSLKNAPVAGFFGLGGKSGLLYEFPKLCDRHKMNIQEE
jgi:hypothetical protein